MTQATDTEIRDLILAMDKKLDIYIARTDEQIKSLETQISDFKKSTETQISDFKKNTDTKFSDLKTDITDVRLQLRSQDNRLWTFVGALFLAVLGFLAKFAFFPGGGS